MGSLLLSIASHQTSKVGGHRKEIPCARHFICLVGSSRCREEPKEWQGLLDRKTTQPNSTSFCALTTFLARQAMATSTGKDLMSSRHCYAGWLYFKEQPPVLAAPSSPHLAWQVGYKGRGFPNTAQKLAP